MTRRAGGVNLAVVGLLDVAVGVALLARGHLTSVLIERLPEVVGEVALVSHASMLWTFVRWAPLLGAVVLCVGAVQLYFGQRAYHARQWRSSVGAAVAGGVNPLAVPAVLVAVTLLILSRDQFTRAESASKRA
ncbi:MAG: hypothetical protein ABEJ26_12170 [Halosimplex sp.]